MNYMALTTGTIFAIIAALSLIFIDGRPGEAFALGLSLFSLNMFLVNHSTMINSKR